MNSRSETTKNALITALAAVLTTYWQRASEGAGFPYFVVDRPSNKAVYTFSYSNQGEDDLFWVKAYCDTESAGTSTAAALLNTKLQAAETAIRALNYAVLERVDLSLPNETDGDRTIYADGFQIRIYSE